MGFVRRYRVPALAWASIAVVLVAIQRLVNVVVNHTPDPWAWPGGHDFFAGWVQFDGWEYVHVADHRYWYAPSSRSPVVFFPLYPLALRAVHGLTGDTVVAGVVVAALAGLVATLLYWRWSTDRGMAGAARATALGVFLLYPFGWYLFGAVYSDALFVALVLGAFVLASKERYVLAGLVGALATATRPTGLAVVPGLWLLALDQAGVLVVPEGARGIVARWQLPVRFDRTRFRAVLVAPLLSLGGVVAYATYLGVRFGRPLVFLTDQSQYQGEGWKTLLKAGLFSRMVQWDDPTYSISTILQGALVVAVAVSIPSVGRRFGWGYGAFVACLVLALTLISRDYLGAGRYLMAAFPVAAWFGERLADRPAWRTAWLVGSGLLLCLGAAGFAQSRMLT